MMFQNPEKNYNTLTIKQIKNYIFILNKKRPYQNDRALSKWIEILLLESEQIRRFTVHYFTALRRQTVSNE
jgi:hypothetical protein